MLGRAVALAATTAACLVASAALAQDAALDTPTAEQMIEVAREEWRSPHLVGCPEPKPGEILVCEETDVEEEEKYGVESSLDEAIRNGETVPDGLPRAPYVLGLPECGVEVTCHRVGRAPEPRLLIDLAALPHPLTPEEARHVYRAEDLPARQASPEAASPEAAP